MLCFLMQAKIFFPVNRLPSGIAFCNNDRSKETEHRKEIQRQQSNKETAVTATQETKETTETKKVFSWEDKPNYKIHTKHKSGYNP